jgi:serine/threonine protein kinase
MAEAGHDKNEIEFLAQGATSCVFSGIKCDNEDEDWKDEKDKVRQNKMKKYITKVLHKGEGKKELEEYQRVKDIFAKNNISTDVQKYIISNAEECVITDRIEEVNASIRGIKNAQGQKCKKNPDYDFISQESAGGKNLQQLLDDKTIEHNAKFYLDLFAGLENIFECVHLLNSRNIYLFDLKLENIVYDETTRQCKIIDIASLDQYNELDPASVERFEKKKLSLIGTTPKYLSPEMLFKSIVLDKKNNKRSLLSAASAVGNPRFDFNIADVKITKDSVTNTVTYSNNFFTNSIDSNYYLDLGLEERFIKNDIWALGIILYEICSYLQADIEKNDTNSGQLLKLHASICELHVISPTPDELDIMSDDCLIKLLYKMVELNISERMSSEKALEFYKNWLAKLQPSKATASAASAKKVRVIKRSSLNRFSKESKGGKILKRKTMKKRKTTKKRRTMKKRKTMKKRRTKKWKL